MNRCRKCNVNIHTSEDICPLCQNKINLKESNSIYPVVKSKYKFHKLLIKISLFISLCSIVICSLINYSLSNEFSWCIFVILGIVSFWFTFINGIAKSENFMSKLFIEILGIIILAIIWDYYTGLHKWSLIYVLPFLCIAYTTTFLILRIFTNKTNKDHILFTYINSLIGLIPLYFILKKNISPLWPSYISVAISILAIIFLFIFNHKALENELERRLHI